jgi:hypothetical protein
MATINKVICDWTGLPGMPGVSVFYSTAGSDPTGDLVTFFNAIKALFPTGLSWTVPPAGDTIDDTTGTLNGSWSGVGAAVVASSAGTPSYSTGVGGMINWRTGGIVNGRRLRGRTFLTSISGAYYNTNGTVSATFLSTVGAAATALAGAGKLRIWHRPPPGASSGSSSLITSGTVPQQVYTLRTRRF